MAGWSSAEQDLAAAAVAATESGAGRDCWDDRARRVNRARRPPAFVRNLAAARHVNIAHGHYPRDPLPPTALDGLAAYLRNSVTAGQGRLYASGLAKFEPGDMERLLVPAHGLLQCQHPM